MEQSFNGSVFGDASYLANPMHSDWGAYGQDSSSDFMSQVASTAASIDASLAFSNPNNVPLPLLKKGATDAQLEQSLGIKNLIRRVQQTLVAGALLSSYNVNGKFDEKTEEAVKEWQEQAGIGVDGKIGPKTYAAFGYSDKVAQVDKKKAASVSSTIVTEVAAPLPFYKRRNVQIGGAVLFTAGLLAYIFWPKGR